MGSHTQNTMGSNQTSFSSPPIIFSSSPFGPRPEVLRSVTNPTHATSLQRQEQYQHALQQQQAFQQHALQQQQQQPLHQFDQSWTNLLMQDTTSVTTQPQQPIAAQPLQPPPIPSPTIQPPQPPQQTQQIIEKRPGRYKKSEELAKMKSFTMKHEFYLGTLEHEVCLHTYTRGFVGL